MSGVAKCYKRLILRYEILSKLLKILQWPILTQLCRRLLGVDLVGRFLLPPVPISWFQWRSSLVLEYLFRSSLPTRYGPNCVLTTGILQYWPASLGTSPWASTQVSTYTSPLDS